MSQATYSTVIAEAPTSVLVAFYNEYSASPGSIKKFADRQTAVRRCLKLFQDALNAGEAESDLLRKLGCNDYFIVAAQSVDLAAIEAAGLAHPLNIEAAHREIAAREAEGEDMTGATVDPRTSAILKPSAAQPVIGEFTHCPHCGIDLNNGVSTYTALREDPDNHNVDTKAMKHEYLCLACNGDFGPKLARRNAAPSEDRSAAIAATWEDPNVKAARSERSHVAVGKQTFRSVRDAFVHLGLPLEKHIKFRGLLKAAGTLQFGDHTFTVVTQQSL